MSRLFIEVPQRPELATASVGLDVIRELMRERSGDVQISISNPTGISPFGINCRIVDWCKDITGLVRFRATPFKVVGL